MLTRGGTRGLARRSRAKMVRQNPVSNHQETSQAGDPELARWLTRDLRPKGAPLSSPPPSSPPPSSPPPSASAPPPSEAEVLAGWLTQDLTPKNSLLPRASGSPADRPPSDRPQAASRLAVSLPAASLPAVSSPPISFPASPFRDVRGSEPPAPV